MNLLQWIRQLVPQSLFDFKVVTVEDKRCLQDGAGETHYVSGAFIKDNVVDVLHPEMVMVTMFDPLPRGKFNPSRPLNR
jgi:hypothetical protein